MKVKYLKSDDFFVVGKKEIYWSSIFVLRQKKSTLKKLRTALEVDDNEINFFKSELKDLEDLGFITRKGYWITTTKKGNEFLKEVQKLTSFKNLRKKGVKDIDEVVSEAKQVLSLAPSHTKAIIKTKYHSERVDWFPLFFNTFTGFWLFMVLTLGFFYVVNPVPFQNMLIDLILSPITAVALIAPAIVFMFVMYQVGQEINWVVFRKR